MDRNVIIGARVQAIRKRQGKTLKQVVGALPDKISHQQLHHYEKGARWPATLLHDVAQILGKDINELLKKQD